jgi:hypothetical protein
LGQRVGIDIVNHDYEIRDADTCFMQEDLTRDLIHGSHLSGSPDNNLTFHGRLVAPVRGWATAIPPRGFSVGRDVKVFEKDLG